MVMKVVNEFYFSDDSGVWIKIRAFKALVEKFYFYGYFFDMKFKVFAKIINNCFRQKII